MLRSPPHAVRDFSLFLALIQDTAAFLSVKTRSKTIFFLLHQRDNSLPARLKEMKSPLLLTRNSVFSRSQSEGIFALQSLKEAKRCEVTRGRPRFSVLSWRRKGSLLLLCHFCLKLHEVAADYKPPHGISLPYSLFLFYFVASFCSSLLLLLLLLRLRV